MGKKDKAGKPEAAKAAGDPGAPTRPPRRKTGPDAQERLLLVSKALSDPTRLSILRRIAAGEGRCGDVRECLGISAATLSHHMKELEHAGLIVSRREGRFVQAALEKKAWKHYIGELKALLP